MATINEKRTSQIILDGKQPAKTIKDLAADIRILGNHLKKLDKDSDAFKSGSKKMRELRNEIREANKQLYNTRTSFQRFWQSVKGVAAGFTLGSIITQGVSAVKDLVKESIQLAEVAKGVRPAFDRLNQPGLLSELRKATKGTVTDLELMKQAVQADNFKLPLDQLGKLFSFASQRARETGESVEYLTQSIILGISRKSIPILDNLGISAVEIQEEVKKVGDFATAVGNIIDREMRKGGKATEWQASKAEQLRATYQNVATNLGTKLKPAFEVVQNAAIGLLSTIGKLIGVTSKHSEELEKERIELKVLESQILDVNTKQEDRIKLIKELQGKYPDYLGHLDAEKASNKEITTAINELNEAMLNRITLVVMQEKIETEARKAAEARIKIRQNEEDLLKKIILAEEEYGIATDKTKSALERFYEMQEKLGPAYNNTGTSINKMADRSNIAMAILEDAGLRYAAEIEKQQTVLDKQKKQVEELKNTQSDLAASMRNVFNLSGNEDDPDPNPKPTDPKPPKTPKKKEGNDLDDKQKQLDALKEQYSQYIQSLKVEDEDYYVSKLQQLDQELNDLDTHYENKLNDLQKFYELGVISAEEYTMQEEALHNSKAEKLEEIQQQYQEKYRENLEAFNEEVNELQLTQTEYEIEQLNKYYDDLIARAEEFGVDTQILEQLRQDGITAIVEQASEQRRQIISDENRMIINEIANTIDQIGRLANEITALQKQESDQRIADMEKGKETSLRVLQEERDMGLISQEEYVAESKRIEEEYSAHIAKERLNQWKKEQKIAIATALIEGGVAFARALSSAPPPFNFIAAAAVAASTLMNVSRIRNEKPPKFKDGGMLTVGPSHQAGGMALLGYNGTKQAELEGGEAILSRETVANNYSIVRQLLEQSTLKAGAAIPQFNYGGMIGAAQQMQPQNVTTTLDAAAFSKAVAEFSQAVKNIEAKVVFNNQLITDLRKNIERQQQQRARGY